MGESVGVTPFAVMVAVVPLINSSANGGTLMVEKVEHDSAAPLKEIDDHIRSEAARPALGAIVSESVALCAPSK